MFGAKTLLALWERVRYRTWQVWVSLRPRIEDTDREELARWLPPRAVALWQRQPLRDQAHSLRVLRRLQTEGFTAPPLMAAALLHDVGKTEAPLRLWHRVVWVLLKRCCPAWQSWLIHPRGWRRPFWALAEHPALGAALARQAGCDEETAWLIAHHQDDISTLAARHPKASRRLRHLEALQRVDDMT